MNDCSHKVSLLKNILCTQALPAKCEHCGSKLVRNHDFTKFLLAGYCAYGGIPLIVLLILFIEQVFVIMTVLVALPLLIYFWETSRNELEVFTNDAQDKYKSRSNKTLLLLGVFILVVFVINYFPL